MNLDCDSVLDVIEWSAEELIGLQILYPHHPHRHHFRYGKPRLVYFTIQQKEKTMSTAPLIRLNQASTLFAVTAFDQYGIPYTGVDLSNTTCISDTPANVGVSLSSFTDGVATLTLTQGGSEGMANVTITDGSVSLEQQVESYVPVLTSFTIAPQAAPAPTPAPAASTTTTATTTAPATAS